jgi:FMN reductase
MGFCRGWQRKRSKEGKMMRPYIVGIGGTTRAGSITEAALRIALSVADRAGAVTQVFAGAAIIFPVYEPDNPRRGKAVLAFIDAVRRADGIMIASPSYHGLPSGCIKNALDYVEDLRNDRNPYFEGKPVGCIVSADGPQSLGSTIAALRSIVHALRGWPTPFSAAINSRSSPFGPAAQSASAEVMQNLELVAQQVIEFARMRIHYEVARAKVLNSGPSNAGDREPAAHDAFNLDLITNHGFKET